MKGPDATDTCMEIQIQNMVCPRCKMMLEERLQEAGLPAEVVAIGSARFARELGVEELHTLDALLAELGFARLQSRKAILLAQIKQAALDWVQGGQAASPYTWSHFLGSRMGMDYGHLSHVFREETGGTLEAFLIAVRTELAKDLLRDENLSLTDIADRLGYSSLPHFSGQFKKETGRTPTEFRKAPTPPRPLDAL